MRESLRWTARSILGVRTTTVVVLAIFVASPQARAQSIECVPAGEMCHTENSGGDDSGALSPANTRISLDAVRLDAHRVAGPIALSVTRRGVSGGTLDVATMPRPGSRLHGQGAVQRPRSLKRQVLGAVVGAVGGFFAGGYVGAWIEGDRCHCDDPGLMGAVIGAPIGAALGGIVGAKYLF